MSAHLSEHPTEWTLRRLHAGELSTDEATRTRTRTHAAHCERCGAVLREAQEAQQRFESELPFERFEAGVTRAEEKARKQELTERASQRRWMAPAMALAATVLLVVAARPLLSSSPVPGVRTKGGAAAELRIGGGGEGTQRVARMDAPEPLAQGERVRIGYTPDTRRYVLALSVDSAGEVTPLYPEAGESLPVEPGAGTHWLPDSIEFTGSGAERVLVLLSDAPMAVDAAIAAARQAFEAGGRDVEKMPPLDVDGDQTSWMLLKP